MFERVEFNINALTPSRAGHQKFVPIRQFNLLEEEGDQPLRMSDDLLVNDEYYEELQNQVPFHDEQEQLG